MRKWATVFVTAVAVMGAASAFSIAGPAGAATHRVNHSPRAVRKQLSTLVVQGASDARIRRSTGLRLVSQVGRTPMSSNSVISVPTPKIYYDSQARYYYATAGWNFTKVPPDGDQDGTDGFGISFSKQINNVGGSLNICAKNGSQVGTCRFADNYADNSAYGAGWKFSSWAFSSLYLAGRGSLVFSFKLLSSGCLQVFTKYAHTWSSTSVTGVSVGKWSLGFAWRSSGHQWTRASAAGKLGCA